MFKLPPLAKLMADNIGNGSGLKAQDNQLYLYDVIGWPFIDAKSVREQLANIEGDTINLRINSPGGDVFEARAIMQALVDDGRPIVAQNDGLAASAASFIPMVAEERKTSEGAFWMIHRAWTVALGNSLDFLSTAEMLEKVDNTIVRDYEKRTGQTNDDLWQWMSAETWMDDAEALERGFSTETVELIKPSNKARWNLSAYDKTPEAVAAAFAADEPNDDGKDAEKAQRERFIQLLNRAA